jgi:hypothetical protein
MVAVKGNFEVTILPGGCTLDSVIKMKTTNVGGRMLPSIGVQSFNFNLDSKKIKIYLGGSISSDIADSLIWMFKSVVIK